MAVTEVYVDPSIAASSGSGTIGDPYGDLQHALDTQARDAVNGDRFNIKVGTDEVLAAPLDLSTYGTPTTTAPLWIEGYTSVQGDGGIGGISGNATHTMFADANLDAIAIVNMHLHNSGASNVLRLDNNCAIVNCEADNGVHGIFVDGGIILGCYVHNCSSYGIRTFNVGMYNYVEQDTQTMTGALYGGGGAKYYFNVIKIDSTSHGIVINGSDVVFANNTVWSDGGTGNGVNIQASNDQFSIFNNVIEGFSGAGGIGLALLAASRGYIVGNNAYFNNETNVSDPGASIAVDLMSSDKILVASPFVDATNGDFAISSALAGFGYPSTVPQIGVNTNMDIGGIGRIPGIQGHSWFPAWFR